MNGFLNQFPYLDFHEMNLDWILKAMKRLAAEMNDYKAAHQISYYGLWDITKQYSAWTIAYYDGHLYLSIQPVPVGVDINNANYWMNVLPFSIDTEFDNDSYNAIANRTVTAKFNDVDDTLENVITNVTNLQTLTTGFTTPLMFGAKGDGITDDTQAFLDCADYCAENNLLMVIPENKSFKIPNNVTLDGVKQIVSKGSIIAPNGLTVIYNSNLTCLSWYFFDVQGTLTLKGIKNGYVTVINCPSLVLEAEAGNEKIDSIAYSHFTLGYVKSLYLHGIGIGWINENTFFGGRIESLIMDGDYSHNNNHFYNNTFEHATIEVHRGKSNYIHNARFEQIESITFDEYASNNYVHASWLNEYMSGANPNVPNYWHDPKGLNFITIGELPFLVNHTKEINNRSFNYNTDKAYPLNGKIHNVSNNPSIIETGLLDISHALSVAISSDVAFFRVSVYLYDENGDQILTEPSQTPLYGRSMTWQDANKRYFSGSNDINICNLTIGKYNISNAANSSVSYVKIVVTGASNADIDHIKMSINTPWYSSISAFTPDKMVGTQAPASGDWSEGDFIYNINSNTAALGWIYNNSAWHQISY